MCYRNYTFTTFVERAPSGAVSAGARAPAGGEAHVPGPTTSPSMCREPHAVMYFMYLYPVIGLALFQCFTVHFSSPTSEQVVANAASACIATDAPAVKGTATKFA